MITRFLSRLKKAHVEALREGPRHKGLFPRYGRAGGPGPHPAKAREDRLWPGREQAERARQGSNYWSSTTNANNPNNAWNVNFNNGNVNNNNKNNNNFVLPVRGS